ncbi:unnamed protein product [Effrenium voratum]|nr:unnamed protein product [Effrenium voratum]
MAGPRACLFAPEELGGLLIRSGGRWKLWKEREAAVELYHNDEKETYTAACWAPPSQAWLVLGCASGRLQCWEASAELLCQAEAFRTLARGAESSVTALAAVAKRGTVFAACAGVPEVLEVGVADGMTRSSFRSGKTGLCGLAATSSDADWLLSASPGAPLKLWRLPAAGAVLTDLKKAKKRFKGPAQSATCLELLCIERHIYVLCADGTAQVEFFDADMDSEGENGKQAPATSTRVLSCHERLGDVRLARHKAGGSLGLLAIGYGATILACWTFDAGAHAARTVVPTFTVSKAELGGSVLCARGVKGRDSELCLLVAHGPAARPSFSQVSPPKSKKGAALIDSLAPAGAEPSGKPEKKSVPAPTVLGPAELATRKRLRTEEVAAVKRQKQLGAQGRPIPRSRPETAGSNLSLAPVLRQALRSQDSISLSKTLTLRDRVLMDTSVSELSGVEAFDLLQECAKRLLDKPPDSSVYCAWIQRVLFHHGTFIRSQPALIDALRPVFEACMARCAFYRGLQRLHGRLHGLVVQGRKALEQQVVEKSARAPLLEYVEGDEDMEEAQEDDDERDAQEEDEDELDSGSDEIDFNDADIDDLLDEAD